MNRTSGKLFIISGPSGVGKTTLYKALLKQFPDMLYSVSYTTRKSRYGEQDGIDYHFITEVDFKKNIETGRWAEWAKVHDHYYGTSAGFLNKGLSSGYDILLDIDVQGTIQIVNYFPDSITIFLLPPSMDALNNRLRLRGSDSESAIEKRLLNAQREVEKKDIYRYVVVNDRLEVAAEKLVSIIEKERLAA
ncbi:MAG: guanylate kinase [Desulfobacterales bacterium]|nr:MAG: guanylate kinase [Desulfobacterales bacterium]